MFAVSKAPPFVGCLSGVAENRDDAPIVLDMATTFKAELAKTLVESPLEKQQDRPDS